MATSSACPSGLKRRDWAGPPEGLGERISVVGSAGSGKSTLAASLAAIARLRRLELDAVNHQANWTPRDPEDFRREVREFVRTPRWVVDGNYTAVGALDLVWERADTVVWLDLPRALSAARVVSRSARRWVTRRELWNGNRERLSALLSPEATKNIILWSWVNHGHVREKFERRSRDPRWRDLKIIRLRSPREVRDWLATLSPPS